MLFNINDQHPLAVTQEVLVTLDFMFDPETSPSAAGAIFDNQSFNEVYQTSCS